MTVEKYIYKYGTNTTSIILRNMAQELQLQDKITQEHLLEILNMASELTEALQKYIES